MTGWDEVEGEDPSIMLSILVDVGQLLGSGPE